MRESASLEEVKDFCNKVREAGGANPLDALMPAIPENAHECLIARNLNFSCEVNTGVIPENDNINVRELGYNKRESVWHMCLDDAEVAATIAESVNLPLWREHLIVLPAKIGRVAERFDDWYLDGVDEEIAQYVEGTTEERIAELKYEYGTK